MSSGCGRTANKNFETCRMQITLLSISLNPPAPTEPLGEVIRHYMNTLCSTQKQTNLTNSLLQDIYVFNGHDTTQLEDWLVDIETAADLTAEGRTKLAQATSKGLTCTLIMSGKLWDDIKDLLWLNICNSDIHTSIYALWGFCKKKKNPSQDTSTILNKILRDVILQIMLPP